jgi:predicted nucleotidyltransferase
MTAWPDIDPDAVLAEMIAVLSAALSARLLSVVAFGSYVHGDFEPARSDVDLLAVLTDDPTPHDVAAIAALLDAVSRRHPEWVDRIEAGLVCREAVTDVLDTGRSRHLVGRISPGEPLHLVPPERRRLLDWEAAARGRTVYGMPDALPSVPWWVTREVLLEELRSWASWVQDLDGAEPLAYGVLTVSRTIAYASTGTPHSKRAGARWLHEREPRFRGLLDNCEAIWYERTPGEGLDRGAVMDFIDETVPQALRELTNACPGASPG